jgi:hypothetical protein
MRSIAYIPAFILLLLTGCKEYPCSKAELRFRLIGFTDSEADTIKLRRFAKNNPVPLDSFVFNANNPVRFNRFGDTLIPVAYSSDLLMQSNYDYQLYLPEATRVFGITDINEIQSSNHKSIFNPTKEGCVNQIMRLEVDGQPVNTIQFPSNVYLKK